MEKGRIYDLAFLLVAFGMFILTLNFKDSVFTRHIWIPMVLAYYLGRYVSARTIKSSVKS